MLDTDGGEEMTKRVLESIGRAAAGIDTATVSDRELEVWRTAMSMLDGAQVVVPFMPKIAEEFPAHLTRARRDLKKTAATIAACTILHQRSRQKDSMGRLIASVDDYAMVHPLLVRVLAPSMTGINDKAIAIDKALRKCQSDWGIDDGDGKWVLLADFIRHCEREVIASPRTVRKWGQFLEEKGYWDLRKQAGNRYEYQPKRRLTSAEDCLPAPEDVEAWMRTEHPQEATADATELSEQNRADSFSGGDE